ncbi:MAG: prfA [Caproiciproducens sp.]|nr:prfA [Caproiciproducens sp.]
MFENLDVFEKRYEELNQKLYDPSVLSNQAMYTELMKEYRNITPIVEKYREYVKANRSMAEAREMMDESGTDRDLKEMADEEFQSAKVDIERFTEELKLLLLPRDPNDERNVIVEIRGGAGGEEAALFSAVLYRMYTMYAESRGWKTEILNTNETEIGGLKEISFMITGDGAYSRLKYESGVHRVQRVPETETQGRVHTSTATVAVLPEAEEVELEINPKDLQIDTFRSSGAGGQHINKTSSAIRITHLPTGTVVECQDERSQYKNKDKAMKVLRSRLFEAKLQEHDAKIASERKSQVGTGDRSERIRTYNYPQGRLTDHRIGLTIYRLDDILNGNIDEVIDALITADRAAKLQDTIDNQSEERDS